MQIIPVLDLMDGRVVRGIAGRRETYAPIQSPLVDSSSPIDVASAFRREFGLNRLYVADLDAITNNTPQWEVMQDLTAERFHLLVDAGLREAARAERLLRCGVSQVVAALETLPGPQSLCELLSRVGSERVVFSLDLMDGRPLGELSAWQSNDAPSIARCAIDLGVTSLIVLDLSSVGVGRGVPTRALCERLRREHPQVALISGGGVRNRADLIELHQAGIGGALVASALHDGRIGREDIAAVEVASRTDRPATE